MARHDGWLPLLLGNDTGCFCEAFCLCCELFCCCLMFCCIYHFELLFTDWEQE